MIDTLKKKVIGSDIEFGKSEDSLKDLILKLDSNYQILYSISEKSVPDKVYIELLNSTFKANIQKIYELLELKQHENE